MSTDRAEDHAFPLSLSFLLSCLVSTALAADEYFQCLEPALSLSGLRSHMTWEWLPPAPIRSWLPVIPYAVLYRGAALVEPYYRHYVYPLLAIDFPAIVTMITHLINAVPTYFALRLLKPLSISFAFAPFLHYAMSRSLANSIETLGVVAVLRLSLYSSNKHPSMDVAIAFCIAGLLIPVRFTSFILTGPLLLGSLLMNISLLSRYVFLGTPCFAFSISVVHVMDCYLHNIPLASIPTWAANIRFNVIAGSSELYGTLPWYWYVPAIALMLGPALPPLLRSWLSVKSSSRLIVARSSALLYLFALSLSPHKEYRFALPALPILLLDASRSPKIPYHAALSYTTFVVLATLHQRGGVACVTKLARFHYPLQRPATLHIMADCHSTPENSHFFSLPVEIRSLDCDPGCRKTESCESHAFLTDHESFLTRFYEDDKNELPDYAIIKGSGSFYEDKGYILFGKEWHAVGEESFEIWIKRKPSDVEAVDVDNVRVEL